MTGGTGGTGGNGFDRIADVYDETRGGTERARGFADRFRQVLDPALPVLDVGTGTGIVAAELAAGGLTVCGVDLSLPMLSHARPRLAGRVMAANAARLPLRDACFSQAISSWVLHLVPDVAAVLADVGRVLRPGGRYFVIPARPKREHDEIGRIVDEMERQLDPDRVKRDDEDRLAALAPAAGLRLAGIRAHLATSFTDSPAKVAEAIESGRFSSVWSASEAQWDAIIGPALAALRALPDAGQDRPRAAVSYLIELVKPGPA